MLAAACPYDAPTLAALARAVREGVIRAVLYGDSERVRAGFETVGEQPPDDVEIICASTPDDALAAAVKAVRDGGADIIMKGLVDTSDFLRAVLSRAGGLRGAGEYGDALLSAFGIFETPRYHKLFAVTDFAMNIAPDLDAKRSILENAAGFLRALGVAEPKIAVLSETEHINPKIQASIDAAELKRMNQSGEISGCVVEGPIAFDLAMSREAAEIKGCDSPVAGDADLILVPDIISGNALVKSLTLFGGAQTAGAVIGAAVPIVMTSRSATPDDKYYSICLSALGLR
jgi:phosphate butyryltransferase